MFVIQADKSKLTIIESEILVRNASNVYPIRFSFSKDWDGFSKIAIFYNDFREDYQRYSKLIDGDGTTQIPNEVLEDSDGTVYVGVCGDSRTSQHLPTIVIPLGRVVDSICDDATESQEPTPGIYNQILSELASIHQDIIDGKLQGPPGPRGPKGEQGIPGEKGADGATGGITKEEMDEAIQNAIDNLPEGGGVTMSEVNNAIKDALKKLPEGVDMNQVNNAIAEALKKLPEGITMEDVNNAIAEAIKSLPKGITMEDVNKAIDEAISTAIDGAIHQVYYGTKGSA